MQKFEAKDFDHYKETVDKGDGNYTKNVVFNLCLVPDPASKEAQNYREKIVAASEWLADHAPTCYTLHLNPKADSTIGSHVHATVTHVVIQNPAANRPIIENEFAAALEEMVGQKIDLPSIGLTFFSSGAPFDRRAQATKQEKLRELMGIKDRVIWGAITLTDELKKARYNAEYILNYASNGLATCIGASGNNMIPHHTAFVQRIVGGDKRGNLPALPWHMNPALQTVPHVLAVGTCGPWGQVTEFTTKPEKVKKFLLHNICKLER